MILKNQLAVYSVLYNIYASVKEIIYTNYKIHNTLRINR